MSVGALQIGALIADKYRIERLLGAGGMGSVYLAENLAISRRVAIKVLHAALGRNETILKRFRLEARASAVIGHPNIVDVLDMGVTADGEAFIVMEHLDGETLSARQKARARLPVPDMVAILVEVLDGLAAAHDKGIIHRDLKPENVFLVRKPGGCGVKILDFGISKLIGDELGVTASNVVMGSVLYMAPEQAKDAGSARVPADLYAIGAMIYHLVAGVPPFLGKSNTEVLSRVLVDLPPPLRERAAHVPEALATLVDQLLAKDPDKRPQSALAVRDALVAIVGGIVLPIDPPPGAAPPRAPADQLAETGLATEASVPRPPPADKPQVTLATGEPTKVAPPRRRVGYAIGGLAIAAGAIATIILVQPNGATAPHDAAIDASEHETIDAYVVAPVDAIEGDKTVPSIDARPIDAAVPDARKEPTSSNTHPLPDAGGATIASDAAPKAGSGSGSSIELMTIPGAK